MKKDTPLAHICSVFQVFLATIILIASQQSTVHADSSVTIPANGKEGTISISDPSVKTVSFISRVKGNISQYIDFSAQGPSGLKGYVDVRQVGRANKLGAKFRLQFPKKKKSTTVLVDGSASKVSAQAHTTLAAEGDPSAEQIERIVKATGLSEAIIKILLRYMTEEQLIAKYGQTSPTNPNSPSSPSPSNPTPATPPGSLAGRALLSKDSCDNSVSEYQIEFVIDLTGIDRNAPGGQGSVSAKITAGESSLAAASIKPISDGKFAPKPLILIESTGYSYYTGSSEVLQLVRWAKGRPGKAKSIKIEDRIFHQGQSLIRAVAQSVLTGGKGTFEVTNGQKAGVACLNLVRSRQRVNGYKGGE
jgi:hypothetical protein